MAGLPPFCVLAAVSGTLSEQYVQELEAVLQRTEADRSGIDVAALPDGRHLVRAPDHTALCDLLAEVTRPPGRGLRIEVDPISF